MTIHGPLREFGRNGYPEIVPGNSYAAITVFSQHGVMVMTNIYPFMDDPNFVFRDAINSPHLTKMQRTVINDPHRKKFWMKEARTYTADPAADLARNAAYDLLRIEHLLKHKFENANNTFEDDVGGWLPIGGNSDGLSQTGSDLFDRQQAKKAGDLETADLIRRVVAGGGVTVSDFPNGTMWVFPR